MHNIDMNRVVFYSPIDMAFRNNFQKVEQILRADTKSSCADINEVLELYSIKEYVDNDQYIKCWTHDDITSFKQKAAEFGKAIGKFIATIDDSNVVIIYKNVLKNYVHLFWKLVNNQSIFKRISKTNFYTILKDEPHLIHEILIHKGIVNHYDTEIKNFLLTYSQSAEILLSIYEVKGRTCNFPWIA